MGKAPLFFLSVIDPAILKIADDRIRIEFDGEAVRVSREIEAAIARSAARGMGGNMLGEAARICAKSAEERANLAWRILHRTVTSAHVEHSDTLEDDLKNALGAHLRIDGLKSEIRDLARRAGMQNLEMVAGVTREIDVAGNVGFRRACNEIELFVASMKNRATAPSSAGHTFNVYAPVGAIQTGTGATASIVQNIDTETKRHLDQVLERLEREVRGATDDVVAAGEIAGLVKDVRDEIAKAQPNKSKLRALLSTTSDAVRTVGALQPAYHAVKMAFAIIGIDLP